MNYSKIAKQMVCKTAILLALTLAACFDSVADGGTAEERNFQANNETPRDTVCETACDTKTSNFSISGRAMRKPEPVSEPDTSNPFELASSMQGSFVTYGSVLRLSELDSVTLDTTGVFYLTRCTDTTGLFSFDSVSLNSPYVLIETLPYIYDDAEWELNKRGKLRDFSDSLLYYGGFSINNNYSAIVDLRTTNNIGINIMTRLEASRIKHLVKDGTDFATAKQQADKEVLEAVGIYNATFEFDKSDFAQDTNNVFIANTVYYAVFSSTSIYSVAPDYTARAVNAFGESGSFTADDSVKAALLMYIKRWDLFNRRNDFIAGFFAATIGLGECTAAREGDTVVTEGNQDQYLNLVCLSGAWVAEPGRYKILERISFETGTVTDERDGKTYKTVTYDIEGTPYTWIAENLTYSNDSIQPEIGIVFSIYNCYYGSGFAQESDFIKFKNSLDSTYWNSIARYSEQEVIGTDTVVMEGEHFQGICPSGYHIPTHDEWTRLFYFVEQVSDYNSDYKNFEDYKENGMFGYYTSRYLPQLEFGEITLEAFAILEQGDDGSWSTQALMLNNWKPNILPTKQIPKFLSVRCVMD